MKKQLLAISLLAATVSLKAQRNNIYPTVPLDTVQYVSPSKLPANDVPDYINPTPLYQFGDTVNIEGIVVMNPKIYGFATNTNTPSTSRVSTWLQRKGGGPWSGVQVMLDPTQMRPTATKSTLLPETRFYDNCIPGFPVRLTVRHGAFSNETQMYLVRNSERSENYVEQLSLNPDTLVYTNITIDSVMTGNLAANTLTQKKVEGEKWEGVLVEIKDVRVIGVSPRGGTRWNWSIQDNAGNQLEIIDISGYFRNDDFEDSIPKIPNNFIPPAIGTGLTYIKGLIVEYAPPGASSARRYGIAPIYPTDLGPCNVCPPSIGLRTRVPSIVTQNDSVTISATILADTAIATAKLYYAHNDSSTFADVDMVKEQSSERWSGKIPPFASNTLVKYYIKVVDGRGLTTIVPDSLANGSVYYVTANGVKNIRDLQYAPNPANGASVWSGDSLNGISVHGVVTATGIFTSASAPRQIAVQDGQGPNSAIFIEGSAGASNWKIGDSVEITAARVAETFNVTTLYNVQGSVLKSGATLPTFETGLSLDSFRLNNVRYARPWEAVLIRWDSVYINNLNPDSNAAGDNFGEFTFNTDSTKTVGLRADDAISSLFGINRTLVKGQFLEYIQGPMTYAFNNFKLIPRNLNDIASCNLDTVKPIIIASTTDSVFVGSGMYNHPNVTANDNKDGNLTPFIVTTGTVNTAAIGTYNVTYTVSDFCGNTISANRTVIVKDTPNTGLERNDIVAANISVYPNPAKDVITISATDVKTLPLNVAVYDMIGREMLTRTYNDKNVNETININNLNNGVYFLVMKNAQGTHSVKFVVTGK